MTGPRIGEKLHEQLHASDEELASTQHPSILRLVQRPDGLALPVQAGLAELRVAAADRNEVRVRRILFDLISEGGPEEEIDEDVKGEQEPLVVQHDLSA
jgi:FlaA1/EpsC-like NDP-sugar epimerase